MPGSRRLVRLRKFAKVGGSGDTVRTMCGRFTLTSPTQEIASQFGIEHLAPVEPRYNIAPTQGVGVVRIADDLFSPPVWLLCHWGLIPPWAKDSKTAARLINARAETVDEKPTFRRAFKSRRCLIPANGFYEWRREGKRKQPYYIQLKGGGLFAFAGLWESWQDKESGKVIPSCTILTTEANALVKPLHDRMPVIMPPEDYGEWLDPKQEDREPLKALLKVYPPQAMTAHPVGLAVNSPRNEGPGLVDMITLE